MPTAQTSRSNPSMTPLMLHESIVGASRWMNETADVTSLT